MAIPLTIWDVALSARQAREVARELSDMGYAISIPFVRQLQTVAAVARFCEPDDEQAQRNLRDRIAVAAGIKPRRPDQQAA